MNLNDFEIHIDEMILERGYDYYENDRVISVEEKESNVYEAKVKGSELYTVEVELDDETNIVDTLCDCPYVMGKYCKHQVAVFFALQDMKNIIPGENSLLSQNRAENRADSGAVRRFPAPKKKPDLKKILSERTKDELVEFLLDIASEYEEIKQRIELMFDEGNDEDEIRNSIELIRAYINKNSDCDGFVNYDNTFDAVDGAYLVLEQARTALEKNKSLHALDLTLCVLHEMVDLLHYADDSGGVIGGVIEESLDFICEIAIDEELSSADKENIFNKLLEEASDRRYEGWTSWRLALLGSCAELVETPILGNKLEKHLDSMLKNKRKSPWGSNYFEERVNLIRYHMIKNIDGHKKAQEFLEQNLHYSDFREMAIESALKKKDYDAVIMLALDGEEMDKDKGGLVRQWKKYRYKAYKLSGKLDEQRKIAVELILDGSFEYYQELKSTYDSKEWLSVYPRIICLLEEQKRINKDVYTRILIEEGEKQKLLEYVKGNPPAVDDFYTYLLPEFKEEVYTLFVQYIEQETLLAHKRSHYRRVCALIRKLKKLGGKQQALDIKQKLCNENKRRPAFLDELSRV
ncbi:MAG TPA: hypothetical protein DCG84_05615 [Peptococcaceae bacterium]|nr:hypothetical protein [Peptococcaceae bacterium]